MHDSSHSSKTIVSSKRILDLLHVDLFGPPSHASLGGNKYCFVIVDDYSRYTWVYFFRSKSETQQTVIDFAKEVERQHGQNILEIRSDNGSERTRMSPRGGVNMRFRTFTSGLTNAE
jgi:hypothetical protein